MAAAAAAAAAKQKGDSMNLGDLAKTMGSAAQMMGAAAQLAQLANQQGQQGNTDPNAEYPAGATAPTGSSINGGGPETSSISNGNTGKSSTGPAINAAGVGANPATSGSTTAEGSNYNSSHMYAEKSTGPLGNTGLEGGTYIGAKPASATGGGASNGTGASQAGGGGRDPASAGEKSGAGSYEVTGGGGMVNRASMMGLKPGNTELADLGPGGAGGLAGDAKTDGLSDLGGGGGGGGAAADDANVPESLFFRVRTRYGSLVKAGRF